MDSIKSRINPLNPEISPDLPQISEVSTPSWRGAFCRARGTGNWTSGPSRRLSIKDRRIGPRRRLWDTNVTGVAGGKMFFGPGSVEGSRHLGFLPSGKLT